MPKTQQDHGAPGPKTSDLFLLGEEIPLQAEGKDHSPGCIVGVPTHSLDLRGLFSSQTPRKVALLALML